MLYNNNRKRGKLNAGEFVKHDPCPYCHSRDNLSVYRVVGSNPARHNATCTGCQRYEPNPAGFLGMSQDRTEEIASRYPSTETTSPSMDSERIFMQVPTLQVQQPKAFLTASKPSLQDVLSEFLTYPIRAIKERGLTLATCERYGVRVSLSTTDGTTIRSHMYPYHKEDGALCGYNERIVEGKIFFGKGDRKDVGLFGSWIPKQGKTLYITEGEIDAMSLYQVLRHNTTLHDFHPSVVSLAHGAGSAVRDITHDFDYVNSFEKVVLLFDQDEPGQKAVKEVCALLAGKVFIAKIPEKDPNAMLMAGKQDELKWAVLTQARAYMPDNILNLAGAWEMFEKEQDEEFFPFPPEYVGLNQKVYGIKECDLIVVTSGTGMGKTQFFRELKYHYHNTTDWHMADISLEETIGTGIGGMISLHLNKRITLPDVHVTSEEKRSAFDHLYSEGRWDGYDFCGGLDDDTLFSKLRWMAATGKKVIWLDHLSIIISEYADQGDERQRIDMIMTKLRRMCQELKLIIFLIVHLKKSSGMSFEEGATPTLDDLRGSGTLKQIPNTILALSRNQQHPDPSCANTSKVTVLKARATGRTGTADYLYFQPDTGRMVVVPEPPGYNQPMEKPKGFGGGAF